MSAQIHPTALVEEGVTVGDGSSIWDNVHIRAPSSIGSECIVGEKTYIAYGVTIGDRVKINAMVYICTGVTIESGVMISAGVIFTNDRFPRAATPDLGRLRSSDPDVSTEETTVHAGATIGAGAVVGPGLEIGRFSMVGMGSVVTRSVADHSLVLGSPARPVGHVCRCGHMLTESMECEECGRIYRLEDGVVRDMS